MAHLPEIVHGRAAKRRRVEAFVVAGQLVEGLPAEEEGILGIAAPNERDRGVQRGHRVFHSAEGGVARAALRVESAGDGDRLDEGGLPHAVFAGDDGDGRVELQTLRGQQLHYRQPRYVGRELGEGRIQARGGDEHGCQRLISANSQAPSSVASRPTAGEVKE